MVPVANRPVIDFILELCGKHGIGEVTLTLHYLPEAIREHVGDGSKYGLKVSYVVEETPLGTAGSVRAAARDQAGTILVMSGDCLTDFDLTAFLAAHRSAGGRVTLGLTRVARPLEYGVVITGSGGRVVKFLEKPSWGEVFSDTVNTGLYLLEPPVLEQVPEGPYDFSRELFPRLLSQGEPLYGVVLDGYWCDIGDLEQYRQAQLDALYGRVQVRLLGRQRGPGVWVEEGAELPEDLAGPLVIGAHAQVSPGAMIGPGTCLGARARVGEGARLYRATVWEGATLEAGAEASEGVVGAGSALGPGSSVYARAVVGDGARIERAARVGPGVKVWPGQTVPEQHALSRHLFSSGAAGGPRWQRGRAEGKLNQELLIEDACRTGVALASLGGPVVLGYAPGAAARAVGRALGAGVWAAGEDSVELGVSCPQLVRHVLSEQQRGTGAYVGTGEAGVIIQLWESDGSALDGARLRRLEQALEGPSPLEAGRTGLLRRARGALGRYVDALSALVSPAPPRPVRLRLPSRGPLARLLDSWCWRQGLEPRWSGEDADLELSASNEAVRVGHRGNVLDDNTVLVLIGQLFFGAGGGCLAVPIHAPGALDQLASRYQGTVVRLPASGPAFAARAKELVIAMGRGQVSQHRFWTDDLLRAGYVLNRLAVTGQTLEEVLAGLPVSHRVEEEVPCPWTRTGQVMRELVAGCSHPGPELVDGIRLSWPGSWVLARPDGERPLYRIYAEGPSMEAAAELAGDWAARVRKLLQS
jgi:mannose-1-phosphate guanylyltransferase/phosphomannomutase